MREPVKVNKFNALGDYVIRIARFKIARHFPCRLRHSAKPVVGLIYTIGVLYNFAFQLAMVSAT